MDFDLVNSSPEGQMELMNMMRQMEELNAELSELPPSDDQFSAASLQSFYNSPSISPVLAAGTPQSPSFFNGTSVHDPAWFPNSATQIANAELSLCGSAYGGSQYYVKPNSVEAMREMIFRIAAMQPIHIDPESVKPPKRRNVRISKDPQSVAARHRRERISERIRILQRLVPGGTKMDTASMLDEAIQYVKFLKTQVQSLERAAAASQSMGGIAGDVSPAAGFTTGDDYNYSCYAKINDQSHEQGMFMMNPTYMFN